MSKTSRFLRKRLSKLSNSAVRKTCRGTGQERGRKHTWTKEHS